MLPEKIAEVREWVDALRLAKETFAFVLDRLPPGARP